MILELADESRRETDRTNCVLSESVGMACIICPSSTFPGESEATATVAKLFNIQIPSSMLLYYMVGSAFLI